MCLAIPGLITEVVDDHNRIVKVDVGGVLRNVNAALLDEDSAWGVAPGDWVLIHVGFAMSKVDEAEAHATLELLQSLGEAYEEELEELKGSEIE